MPPLKSPISSYCIIVVISKMKNVYLLCIVLCLLHKKLLCLTSTLYLPAPSPPLCFSFFTLSGSLCRLLLELLELLFDKFKAVAQAHGVVLAHLQEIAVQCPGGAHEEGIKLYEQADVSAKIQTVLQVSFEQ